MVPAQIIIEGVSIREYNELKKKFEGLTYDERIDRLTANPYNSYDNSLTNLESRMSGMPIALAKVIEINAKEIREYELDIRKALEDLRK